MFPLLVHIIFHPKSENARTLAEKIHLSLNDDPVVPGLRIPTLFAIEDGTELPPLHGDYLMSADNDEKKMILVLSDDFLKVGYRGEVPSSRRNWGEWIADLYEACEKNPRFRCIPFQMTENARPLDERLQDVSFPRAWVIDEDKRDDWVVDRVILELVRFLHGDVKANDHHPVVPLKVFVSHTKMDMEKKPKVVQSIMRYLTQDKPVDVWFDSGDIGAGSRFAKEIDKGIQDSALLSVLTDSYSSREWCREEVRLAKEYQRPVVVIDALQSIEIRSSADGGNVPVIRWTGDPGAALSLLFKETLRQFHAKLILEQHKQPDDTILTTSPELLTVSGRSKKIFLYPDPPLGDGEIKRLSKAGVVVETPLQRFARNRPLEGHQIALSLSESGDTERYGMGTVHLDQAAIEISRYLLLAGATLCYGGHLGSEGYTTALFELVKKHAIPDVPPFERIRNYLGWPLPLPIEKEAKYSGVTAKFIRTPRPDDVTEKDNPLFVEIIENFFPADSAMKRFAWARGMTVMRETQAKDKNINARIVLGGKIGPTVTAQADGSRKESWYLSRIPGVLEEVLCSIKNNQPVFILGGFGGCARLASDLLQGKHRDKMSWAFHKDAPFAPEMRDLYESRQGLSWWGYGEMTEFLKNAGIQSLNNGLTEADNRRLFETIRIPEIIELVLKGLCSLFSGKKSV